MDYRSKLVILGGLLASPAFAFYVTPAVPEVFKTVGGVGYLSISSADTAFANGIRSKITANLASAGGGAKIPVAYRFASTAGKAAAGAAFGFPGLFLAIGAAVAYEYFTSQGAAVVDNQWVRQNNLGGCFVGPCYLYRVSTNFPWTTHSGAISQFSVPNNGTNNYSEYFANVVASPGQISGIRGDRWSYWNQVATYQNTSTVLTLSRREVPPDVPNLVPMTKPELEELMDGKPIPLGVPQAWPLPSPFWWPVQNPILSPSPLNPADPLAVPTPVPYRTPLGDPVPIPNTNPQQYRTPVIDIFPSPTIDDPWRVDVQPKDIISESPEPIPPAPIVDPAPDPNTQETPTEPSDLCLLHPEILACQVVKPGTLDPVDVPTENRPMSITPDGGWGPNSGSCPAPKTASIMGVTLEMPFTMLCDFAVQIKPLLIAFAWLSAALTFFGFAKRD